MIGHVAGYHLETEQLRREVRADRCGLGLHDLKQRLLRECPRGAEEPERLVAHPRPAPDSASLIASCSSGDRLYADCARAIGFAYVRASRRPLIQEMTSPSPYSFSRAA